jgi:hypothetical protein
MPLKKRRQKVSTTPPENPPTENSTETVGNATAPESTHETRLQWLEKEMRKLLHLPEDAPLDAE